MIPVVNSLQKHLSNKAMFLISDLTYSQIFQIDNVSIR